MTRHPFVFSVILLVTLVVLTVAARILLPSTPVGDISGLSTEALEPPSLLEQSITALKNADNLFWLLALAFAAVVLTLLGWWHGAGFRQPRWRKLYLLLFPLAVCIFALSDGYLLPDAGPLVTGLLVVFVAALGEEAIFRGLLWRAFIPRDPVQTVIITSVLTGVLYLARSTNDAVPEAIRLTTVATCGAFTYGAIRWRTASIWPAVFVHTALAYVPTISALGSAKYPILVWVSTLGFVLYGLFLLRNRRVRSDGG